MPGRLALASSMSEVVRGQEHVLLGLTEELVGDHRGVARAAHVEIGPYELRSRRSFRGAPRLRQEAEGQRRLRRLHRALRERVHEPLDIARVAITHESLDLESPRRQLEGAALERVRDRLERRGGQSSCRRGHASSPKNARSAVSTVGTTNARSSSSL